MTGGAGTETGARGPARRTGPGDAEVVARVLTERWGGTRVVVHGTAHEAHRLRPSASEPIARSPASCPSSSRRKASSAVAAYRPALLSKYRCASAPQVPVARTTIRTTDTGPAVRTGRRVAPGPGRHHNCFVRVKNTPSQGS